MKNQLFIWPSHQTTSPIRWLEWNPQNTAAIATGTLNDASKLVQLQPIADKSTTLLLLPGECCLHTRIKLPDRSKLAKRTIPFQLEEKLCQPIEALQIVYGSLDSSLNIPVVSIEKSVLQSWIEALEKARIQADRVLPDYLALPNTDNQATLLQDGERVLCRTPDMAATLDKRTLTPWWSLVPQPDNIQCFGNIDVAQDNSVTSLPTDKDALETLARHFNPKTGINLLQGEFEQRNALHDWAIKLKLPAIAASLFILLQFATLQLENIQLQRQISQYDNQIEQVFRSAFPDTRRIINARSQMKAKLAVLERSNSHTTFLSILGHAAPELAKNPDIKLQQMRFQADDGSLKLQVTAPDFMALDKLNNRLQNKPLRIKPGSFQQTGGNQITGQLTLWGNKDA